MTDLHSQQPDAPTPKRSGATCATAESWGHHKLVTALCIAWALFQLSLPRLIILPSITVRAVHLAFAMSLVFLTRPLIGRRRAALNQVWPVAGRWRILSFVLAIVAVGSSLYIVIDWVGISQRAGLPIWRDVLLGTILTVLVLEASRRAIGPALSVIAVLFTLYAFFGPYMPPILAFGGVSLRRYLSQIALSDEGIYGIPLGVSASTVYLFVLLGAMLERIGAGYFFNDLAVSLLGRFKGGAAKAAIVSSGLTGLVSGSSIANVVTTGTFTIPLMKKVGYPAKIAAATEVAASTNGQLMPPIMGAAAFIIAEYLGMPYIKVIRAAALPAFVSYFALFYIAHLEASKLGMKGLPRHEIPRFTTVVRRGFHFLIPLVILIFELVVMQHSARLAAFNAIIVLVVVAFARAILQALADGTAIRAALWKVCVSIGEGMVAGSRNMVSVAMATAAAGIVVGVVAMGISGMVAQVVETISGGNIFLLLTITAIASLVLGMGLPTTATYIVMASITAPVIVATGVSGRYELVIPAIAAHLFCFYFGILADDTPPVGLAAYAASAIAGSDPLRTGLHGFLYDLRTAIIPFMFVFNSELLLLGVTDPGRIVLIFAMATLGAFAFANATQGWLIIKNRWYECALLIAASLILFCPTIVTRLFGLNRQFRYYMYMVGLLLYVAAYVLQRYRIRRIH